MHCLNIFSRILACRTQYGRYHCGDTKLLQQNELPDCVAQNGAWTTQVVEKMVASAEGMNRVLTTLSLLLLMECIFRKKSQNWPK